MRLNLPLSLFILITAIFSLVKWEDESYKSDLKTSLIRTSELNKVLEMEITAVKSVNETLQNEVRRLEEKESELLQQVSSLQQKKTILTTSQKSPLSDVELDLLYRLVECEAGGENEEGKIAVANVVFNRVRSEKFPDTLSEVIYQPYQFEPVLTEKIDNVVASEETILAVNKAVNGVKIIDDDVVYFWAKWLDKTHEIWQACPIVKTIGVHHFSNIWN